MACEEAEALDLLDPLARFAQLILLAIRIRNWALMMSKLDS